MSTLHITIGSKSFVIYNEEAGYLAQLAQEAHYEGQLDLAEKLLIAGAQVEAGGLSFESAFDAIAEEFGPCLFLDRARLLAV